MTKSADLQAWRRDIHQYPELGFNELRTAAKVAYLLREFGLEVHENIGRTGVVGVLRRSTNDNTPKKAIGLRADMDALPIQEGNAFSYRSKHDGVFHGCGHDGHSAMLLGAAQALAQGSEFDGTGTFHGTVYFIFQPSEEDGQGALAMINDGLFERFPMQAVYGLHNMPGWPAGHFAVRQGAIMTSEDIFEINIVGRGGHASMPEQAIDPILIGSEIILALQTIVSRSISSRDWAVVSVTEFITDGARNIIPSNVTIKGDCRALSPDVQATIVRRMRELVKGICTSHGATGTVHYQNDFIATINSPAETQHGINAARAVSGQAGITEDCPTCGASEDFARMLQVKPGCYMLLGNGNEGTCATALHNPHYELNEDILALGCEYWQHLVRQQLPPA